MLSDSTNIINSSTTIKYMELTTVEKNLKVLREY